MGPMKLGINIFNLPHVCCVQKFIATSLCLIVLSSPCVRLKYENENSIHFSHLLQGISGSILLKNCKKCIMDNLI